MKPLRLYVAADGPRNQDEKAICEQVREIAIDVDWDCTVQTLFREKNLGCGRAISGAVNWFFEHEPEGIVLEDDCLPSDSFFGFCSSMLEKYRNDERIGHICGSNFQGGIIRGDGSYYFSTLTHGCGWAGWHRVLKDYSFQLSSYPLFNKLKYLDYKPAHVRFKDYWSYFFNLHVEERVDSWDFQYAYLNLINNRLSIMPNSNLTTNIGCFDNPTHFVNNYPFANIPLSEMDDIVHPSFFVANIDADIHSQNIELGISSSEFCVDSFSFIKEKLVKAISQEKNTMKIPKIIHQIFFDMNGVPDHLSAISKSWEKKHPNWEYRFWNKQTVEQFLESDFSDLIPLYNSFPFDVQRWDFVRYLILYHFGGIYVDMDYECLEPLEPLLLNSTCCMGLEPTAHANRYKKPFIVGNALMATVRGHEYFNQIIQYIASGGWEKYKSQGLQVVESTGPFMTTRVFDSYKQKDEITLLPAELIAPLSSLEVQQLITGNDTPEIYEKLEKTFAVHYFFGSWYKQIKR
jgi:hypothetical protein